MGASVIYRLPSASSCLPLLAIYLMVGCSPVLKVSRLEPAEVNLGASKQLSIVQIEGRRRVRDEILRGLTSQARKEGYFQVKNRLGEGATLEVKGDTVEVSGGAAAPLLAEDEIGIRIDIKEWEAEAGSEIVDKTDKDGKVIGKEKVDFFNGLAVVAVTAVGSDGKAPLLASEYKATARSSSSTEEALRHAGIKITSAILSDITPREVMDELTMDDDDEALHPMLVLALKGDIKNARLWMEEYLLDDPDNASAVYNLAVLHDASGDYPKALELYERAISMSAKDYYQEMKGACLRRRAAQQALAK